MRAVPWFSTGTIFGVSAPLFIFFSLLILWVLFKGFEKILGVLVFAAGVAALWWFLTLPR